MFISITLTPFSPGIARGIKMVLFTLIEKVFKNEWTRQFITFCMVGALGTILNYSIYFILLRFFEVYYLISSALGFVLPIFVVFPLNKRLTFRVLEKKGVTGMFMKYFMVCAFSLFLDQLSMIVQVELFHVNYYIAKVFTLGVTTSSNFLGSKFFAFK